MGDPKHAEAPANQPKQCLRAHAPKLQESMHNDDDVP